METGREKMKICKVIKGLLADEAADGQKRKVLARFVNAHLRFLFQETFKFSWSNGVNLYAVKHRHSSTECYYYGYYDPMEMHFVKKYIKDGDVFADVGSNIGSWALFAASCGAEVYAIEPAPSTFNLLKRNIVLNPEIKEKILAVNSAVGETKGELLFTVGRDSENCVVTEEIHGVTTQSVPCDSLDNICRKKIEIAKIDVENYEIPTLKGGKNMLSSGFPNVIIIEAFDNYEQIKELLNSYGFEQYRYEFKKNEIYRDTGRSKRGNNVLFIKDIRRVEDRIGCKLI